MLQRKTLADNVLITQYLSGDELSLEILISRHQEKIFNYIQSKTQDYNLSNDVFQDAFIKIINSLKRGKYNEEGKFLPWAMRICHNLMMDHFRSEKRMVKKRSTDEYDVFNFIITEDVNVEDAYFEKDVVSKLHYLIEGLPKDQQLVLKQRIFNELSFKEIAEMEDISINTALGRMRYAIINLRKQIAENNLELLRQ